MLTKTTLKRSIVFILLSALSNIAVSETLVIGQLSDRPKKDFKQLRPMVQFVAKKLSHLGITGGTVKLYHNMPDLVAAMQSGEVHWVTETAFTAATLVSEANATVIAHKWKDGQESYHSVVFSHVDSDIQDLSGLINKTVAFEHSTSFSSYYLPRKLFEDNGLKLQPLESPSASVNPGMLGFVFSRNEKNNVLWTHKKLVDVGVLNDQDWENTKRLPPKLKQDLKVIYRSPAYPRALELISPTISPEVSEALRDTLLSLNAENAKKVMDKYENTTKFEAVTPDVKQLLIDIYNSSRSW